MKSKSRNNISLAPPPPLHTHTPTHLRSQRIGSPWLKQGGTYTYIKTVTQTFSYVRGWNTSSPHLLTGQTLGIAEIDSSSKWENPDFIEVIKATRVLPWPVVTVIFLCVFFPISHCHELPHTVHFVSPKFLCCCDARKLCLWRLRWHTAHD